MQERKLIVAQHRLVPGAVGAEIGDIDAQRFSNERFDRYTRITSRRGFEFRQLADEAIHENEQRLTFRTKMEIEATNGDAGAAADFIEGGGIISALGKRCERCIEQRGPVATASFLARRRQKRLAGDELWKRNRGAGFGFRPRAPRQGTIRSIWQAPRVDLPEGTFVNPQSR